MNMKVTVKKPDKKTRTVTQEPKIFRAEEPDTKGLQDTVLVLMYTNVYLKFHSHTKHGKGRFVVVFN
jgi:hypothetical protein